VCAIFLYFLHLKKEKVKQTILEIATASNLLQHALDFLATEVTRKLFLLPLLFGTF
jgi:hypothetical protein